MTSNYFRMFACAAVCVAAAICPAFGQTEKRSLPENDAKEQGNSSLDGAAIESRIALFSDTTSGQRHAKDAEQFQTVAIAFIAAISAHDAQQVPSRCTVPFYFEDEQFLDQESLTIRLREVIFPGVFALAKNKKILLVDTLEQLEQLLDMRVPKEARKMWAEHTAHSSRIALVSGGPMLVGLSLRKKEAEYSVSGLLFAYFPKEDAPILKALNGGLLNQQ